MNREYLNFAQNQPNVMSDEKTLTVDLEKVIRDKNPALARLLPRFVVAYLKRTIHQDEINRILQAYSHLEPIPFIRAALADMGIRYRAVGLEKLPREGRYLFASNHPFGGMDGMMLCDELERHFGSVKIIVNDLLMHLTPLNPLFIPVNKHGRAEGAVRRTAPGKPAKRRAGRHVPGRALLAPAPGRRAGLPVATQFHQKRDRKPPRRRSGLFRRGTVVFFLQPVQLPHRRGHPGQSRNVYLPDEMFRQRGKDFRIRFGKPVPWQRLDDREARESMGGTAPGNTYINLKTNKKTAKYYFVDLFLYFCSSNQNTR